MKRLMICLMLLMLPCVALANGWGAPGGTVELFEHNGDYADYTCMVNDYAQNDDAAQLIMHSRYHNQLICTEKVDGHWRMAHTSTKAVYQPGEANADKATLTRVPNGFVLSYPDEWYEFAYEDDRLVLQCAQVGDVSFARTDGGMLVTTWGEDSRTVWQLLNNELTLEDFNIRLFPREEYEVWRLNELWAVIAGDFWLDSAANGTPIDKKLPVYSAPSEDSWRGADGKASVSLRDTEGLYTFGMIGDWQLIEYRVSLGASRVGYIQQEIEYGNWPLLPTAVHAFNDTWLTDDPNVSQHHLMTIPEDTELTALSVYPPAYAYVETTLEDKPIRGFVPLRDLEIERERVRVDGLAGVWVEADTCLVLNDRARHFMTYDLSAHTARITGSMLTRRQGGYWEVISCDPERFDGATDRALVLQYEDGTAECLGLILDGDGTLRLSDYESYRILQRAEAGQDEIERNMMALVAGRYELYAGGSMLPGDGFTLYPDGTMETHDNPAYEGTWFITRYNPAEAAIWDFPEYAIHISLDNGYSCVRGCKYQWVEPGDWNWEEEEPFLCLDMSSNEGGGGYMRIDVGAGIIPGISGRYRFTSGDALLTDYLFISPDGRLEIGTDARIDEAGYWVPGANGESRDLTDMTFCFSDGSPIHPGEMLRMDCAFTPGTDASPASLTFTFDGQSGTYAWYEAPGNG